MASTDLGGTWYYSCVVSANCFLQQWIQELNEIETNVVAKNPERVIDCRQQSETTSPEI